MNRLINATITKVRPMTPHELGQEGWQDYAHDRPMALELSTGIVLYASRDYEGNGPGAMFFYDTTITDLDKRGGTVLFQDATVPSTVRSTS